MTSKFFKIALTRVHTLYHNFWTWYLNVVYTISVLCPTLPTVRPLENRTVAHFSYEIGSLWKVGVAFFAGPTHQPFWWFHTWARFLAQYRYCTDGTPKNFVQKNLYQRYQVRTEGTHGKTFLADLQLVRTDGTNGKKFVQIYHWYVPMVQMRNHFLQNYHWYVPMVQNGKIFSIFAQK